MIKRVALLLIILLLSLSSPALAAGPGSGVIDGQLVNGTAGGSSVADQTVTLTTYLDEIKTGNSTAKTSADGKFIFNGLSTASGNSYDVKLRYQEADYISELLSLADNATAKSTTLTVYDSTSSDSDISITAAHIIIFPGDGNLEVREIIEFTNDSDRSYVGSGDITPTGGKRTLKIPLPPEATSFKFGGDLVMGRVLPDVVGLVDTMAVLPGEKVIDYSYIVDYSSGSYKFSQKFDYPIGSYTFLVQGEDTNVSSTELTVGEPVDLDGTKYSILSGGNLAAGAILNVELSVLSRTGSSRSGNQQTIILVVLVLMAVLGGGAGFVYMMKKRNPQPVRLEGSPEEVKRQLLLDIARLDDDFESGKIEKETYTKLRAERKSRLVGLMQGSQEESDRG